VVRVFNSQFIAPQHHPQLQITGIDITQSNLDISQRKAAQLSNFTVGPGNFNAIPHPDQQFDLAFGIECLCYSLDNSQTLTELHRVLAPGGRLVVFDAYRNPGFENFSSDLQTATKLIEASMAVQGGMNRIDHWQTASEAVSLRTLESTDVTAATRPNIDRFYRLATRYFSSNDLIRARHPLVAALPDAQRHRGVAEPDGVRCRGVGLLPRRSRAPWGWPSIHLIPKTLASDCH
jgi:arsenite methyltransferase